MKIIIGLILTIITCQAVTGQTLMSEEMAKIIDTLGLNKSPQENSGQSRRKNLESNGAYLYKLDSVIYKEYPESFLFPKTNRTTFHYDENNVHIATSSRVTNAENQLIGVSHIDYTYTSTGQPHEIIRYNSGTSLILHPQIKESFSYDSLGNLIENTLHSFSELNNQWTAATTYRHTNDSLGRKTKTVSVGFGFSQEGEPFYESLYYYDDETGRLILVENFRVQNNVKTWDNKLNYTYFDVDNSYVEIQSNLWPNSQGVDDWTPTIRQDYNFNSQDKIVNYNYYHLYPSVQHTNWQHHEYNEDFNLTRRTNTYNPNTLIEYTNYKEEFEFDNSVSAGDIFIPTIIREEIYGFDIFNSKCEKKRMYSRSNGSSPWPENYSEFTFFYSKFKSKVELEEGTFIYPNPASTVLNTIYPANTQFRLYNTLGQVVFETTTTIDNETLTLPALVTGTYIYKSSIDDGKVVIR